jgi:protein-S-isoprenylcysteine O-methyltransferase Ste14
MRLTTANLLINAAYYGVTLVLLPWLALRLEDAVGVPRLASVSLRLVGGVAVAAGGLLQMWCIAVFQRYGQGTPSPARPTQRLVARGPYRLVRNPMNMGEVLVFLGLACWFGSLALLVYAALAAAAFHIFIMAVEEPRNARDFGTSYAEYRRGVGRWLPRPPADH